MPPLPQPFKTAERRIRRKRHNIVSAPGPAALVLVSAEYNHDEARVVILSFDRPIDIDRLDGSQITVDDGNDSGLMFAGTAGATLDDPNTVRIGLNEIGDATGVETTLTAGTGNGIAAAEDAGAWAGVSGLDLPYP